MFDDNELRKSERRSTMARRVSDRRVAFYEFGSPEWQANIVANYAYLPNKDRRLFNRRHHERRTSERRQQQLPGTNRLSKNHHQFILTPEERKLINDLFFL